MNAFKEFILNLFNAKSKNDVELGMTATTDSERAFQIETFATFTVIDFIARILAKCEIQTFKDGKPFKGEEWYSLNYQPNSNQNAYDFFYEFYSTLLFESEVLVFPVGAQLLIAEGFSVDTYATRQYQFYNLQKDTLTFNNKYSMSDVIYCRHCNTNIRGLLNGIISKYSEVIQSAADSYILSSGKKGILNVGAINMNDPTAEKKYRELVNNSFRKFFKEKNAVLPLYQGFTYTDISNSEKGSAANNKATDFKNLFDDALTRAAQAYQIPPVIFKGEVENTENAMDLLITSCLTPIASSVSKEFTRKKYSPDEVIKGNYMKVDTSKIKSVDIFAMASNIDKLIACSFTDVDELREKADLYAYNEDWSRQHYLTKNYERTDKIENVEGGEE